MKTTKTELDLLVRELRSAAENIKGAADALEAIYRDDPETEAQPQTAEASKEEPITITFPEVRALLAEKARAGFKDKIRELLAKYGADRLSDVDPAHFADLVAEAEGWTDAT